MKPAQRRRAAGPARHRRRPDRRRCPEARRLCGDHQRCQPGLSAEPDRMRFSAMNKAPTTLIIMDGFGLAAPSAGNAVSLAQTPGAGSAVCRICPYHPVRQRPGRGSARRADGQQRGGPHQHRRRPGGVPGPAPHHQRHRRMAAFFANAAYNKAMDDCLEKRHAACTCMGLLSDGGVHSHIQHLFALLQMAKEQGSEPGVCPRVSGRAGRVPHLAARTSSPS